MSQSSFGTLPKRVAVAAVAIPIILWVTLQGGYWFGIMIASISAIALLEFYVLSERKGASPLRFVGLLFGPLVTLGFLYDRWHLDFFRILERAGSPVAMPNQLQFLLIVFLLFLLTTLLVELFRQRGSPFANIGSTVSGVAIISLCFGTLIGLREVFTFGFPAHKFASMGVEGALDTDTVNLWGGATVASLFASIWICDTAAYFVGVSIGRHKLFERVSPKKTWEGFVGGLAGGVLAMILAKSLVLDYLTMGHAVILGVVIGVFGQIGDLVESRFKRDADVKDSSALIPGHGGVYDRFDSLVFLSPIVYLYIDFIVLS